MFILKRWLSYDSIPSSKDEKNKKKKKNESSLSQKQQQQQIYYSIDTRRIIQEKGTGYLR
jgi:hypothetical protein